MSIQDKRREAFEDWYAKQFNIETGRTLDPKEFERLRGDEGNYRRYPSLRGKWEGWNAALDSVEIELPGLFIQQPEKLYPTRWLLDAIESAGLKVKS